MEPIGPQVKEFLGALGFITSKLDIRITYEKDAQGNLIGKIIAEGPIAE